VLKKIKWLQKYFLGLCGLLTESVESPDIGTVVESKSELLILN
jgi:hypothetical protein